MRRQLLNILHLNIYIKNYKDTELMGGAPFVVKVLGQNKIGFYNFKEIS